MRSTSKFKKELNKKQSRDVGLAEKIITMLANDEHLPQNIVTTR